MAMPQRDDTIEASKRLDVLREDAVVHGDEECSGASAGSRISIRESVEVGAGSGMGCGERSDGVGAAG